MDEFALAQLVRKILAEELEKLNGKEKHSLLHSHKEKALFVVPKDLFSFGIFYNHIQQEYNNYQIHIAAENAHVLYGCYQSSNTMYIDLCEEEEKAMLYANILGYSRVFVLMNCPLVAKAIYELAPDNYVVQLAFYSLSQNKQVQAMWAFDKDSPVSKEIRTAQKRLEVMGMKSINIKAFNEEVKVNELKAEGVITEQMVLDAHRRGLNEIESRQDQLITPLAKDRARELGIQISRFKG